MTELPDVIPGVANLVLSLVRFFMGVGLVTAPLPTRERFAARAVRASTAVGLLYALLAGAILLTTMRQSAAAFLVGQLATYSLLLAGLVMAVTYVYDTNLWTALFCCAAGYAIENFASGAVELVWSVTTGRSVGGDAMGMPRLLALSAACMIVTYGCFYLLVTRRLLVDGIGRMEDHATLVLFAIVILVIIGFDILIKWLVDGGLPLGAIVLLRAFHGIVCVFTLHAGFALLVRRNLEGERDALRQIVAERERQYEASRSNVEAINARVHDIRHAIGRLAEDAEVERSVLAEMVREVDIYDASIHTGSLPVDTVLAERQLMCRREGVAFTYMVDGTALGLLDTGDAYALFDALLDVALAQTASLADGRSISLGAHGEAGAVLVHVEATCGPEADVAGEQVERARRICERYGGSLGVQRMGGSLQLNALLLG